ncbi:MAG: VRR-NUC domain-containing protein [Marinobacterium sp.]|nr:VRR-NUC domain-containing protein [Marinobacterium sp.]
MQPEADLPDNYYLTNFQALMDHSLKLYDDLLPDYAHAQLKAFKQCPQNAQQLFVRLVCRKGTFFRCDRLHYPEIDKLNEAAQALAEHGLLAINPPLDVTVQCALLTVPELRKQGAQGKRRDALVKHLISTAQPLELVFDVWQKPDTQLAALLSLFYFGNLQQDLSAFVLRDLGRQRYENYPLTTANRLFQHPEQPRLLLQLEKLLQALDTGESLPDTEALRQFLPATEVPMLPALQRRIYRLGRELERQQRLEEALHCYHLSQQPPARERTVRILARQQPEQALQHCQQIAATPLDVTEQSFAESFLPRLRRQLGGPAVPRKKQTWPEQQLSIPIALHHTDRIERLVLQHYQQQGWQGVWCENELPCALFGLLCWDVIFADLPGAFSHPFQRGPLDLHSPDFFQRRQTLFTDCFRGLEQHDNLSALLLQRWQQKQGIHNSFVSWKLDFEVLQQAIYCIPRNQLIALLRQLAFDCQHYRSGWPDLFLWCNDTHQPDWQLIEVKGPGDSLQASQKRWLHLFNSLSIPHHICHVKYHPAEENMGDDEPERDLPV